MDEEEVGEEVDTRGIAWTVYNRKSIDFNQWSNKIIFTRVIWVSLQLV
jgi:hypothetical protein